MPLYRGFGACVLSDYDWACPDLAHLEAKAKKKALWTVYGVKQRVEPQQTRSVFQAFDQAIQLLQVKPMAFLEKRPVISNFADHQPQFGAKPKKEVKDSLDLLEDWVKQIERRGHPAPKGSRLTSWGIPFATWTSPYSCHIMKSTKDCETLAYHQMDPGRLLHAFVCRASANLDEGQLLLLLPGSPAESLLCWLEGLPGTSHKIVKWDDLDTTRFESKISKSLRKKIGQYPLPAQYAIRDPHTSTKLSLPVTSPSRTPLEHPNTVSPPPYSPTRAVIHEGRTPPPAVELGLPEPGELATSPATPKQPQSLGSAGVASTSTHLSNGSVVIGKKSIHTLRRKQTPAAAASEPTANAISTSAEGSSVAPQEIGSSGMAPTELPSHNNAASFTLSTSFAAVELPTDFQSEAPSRLIPTKPESTSELVELPSQQVLATALTKEPESIANREPSVSSQQPNAGSVDAAIGSQTSHIKDSDITKRENTGSSDHYLELLNKVARGEISPQALGAMLQQEKSSVAGSSNSSMSSASTKPTTSLPYPLTEGEQKLPYPLSPTDGGTSADKPEKTPENEIPASLRPGAS